MFRASPRFPSESIEKKNPRKILRNSNIQKSDYNNQKNHDQYFLSSYYALLIIKPLLYINLFIFMIKLWEHVIFLLYRTGNRSTKICDQPTVSLSHTHTQVSSGRERP